MQATIYNLAGDVVENVELDDAIFGVTPNMAVIQQAVLRQQANARQGTHDTKTRAEVRGGGRKPWRQKGTGRARQGSTRSPQWRHGGVAFGPHPRSYEQDMPRKMRRIAIRGVLSAKAADGQLVLVDSFEDLEPRTKSMAETLVKLNVGEKSALILTAGGEDNLIKAASNLAKVKTQSAHLLSLVDMLKHDYLVLHRGSLDVITTILGNTGGRRKFTITRTNGSNGAVAVDEPVVEDEVVEVEAAAPKAARTRAPKAAKAPAADNVAFAPTGEVADTAEATLTGDVEEAK